MNRAIKETPTHPDLPWSFQTLPIYRVIGLMAAVVLPLSFFLVADPQKSGWPVTLVFGALALYIVWRLFNSTIQKVRCSAEGVSQSGLFTRDKSLAWEKITELNIISGFRTGYNLYIQTPDDDIRISVQLYRREDLLAFCGLLRGKATRVQNDDALKSIEDSFRDHRDSEGDAR